MAVFIQKAVQRRIRPRLAQSNSRPQTLEEFCKNVTWRDITETVEELLIADWDSTVKALRNGHSR